MFDLAQASGLWGQWASHLVAAERCTIGAKNCASRERDLLNSHEQDATDYNTALDKANAEKFAVAMLTR